METYYVSAHETYVRDYKVEAESKEEAIKLVKDGGADFYAEDFIECKVDKDGVLTEEEENL
tara:strand:+ start:201 stop:383 length:183 start_codon:yes stop_codon:yes gene_type:complete